MIFNYYFQMWSISITDLFPYSLSFCRYFTPCSMVCICVSFVLVYSYIRFLIKSCLKGGEDGVIEIPEELLDDAIDSNSSTG